MRLLFSLHKDAIFLSHRIPVARGAQAGGAEVHVAAMETGAAGGIRAEGMQFHPLPIVPQGLNPLRDLKMLFALVRLYRKVQPDLIHQVTIKSVIFGCIAAWLTGHRAVVNALPGLGLVFSENPKGRLIRPIVRALYRLAFRLVPTSLTIFQNPDDLAKFVGWGLLPRERAVLIRSSGVNCRQFAFTPEPEGTPLVILPSRMMWDKGVGEFVKAAELLRARGYQARFALVGGSDEGNTTAVPEATLRHWHEAGVVEWWGHRADMPQVLAQSAIVTLPTTYPEGVPKALLEAAATGRPIVATDAPGCREIVKSGVNGFLVGRGDAEGLADAIARLLDSPELRAEFGRAGRELAVEEFSEERVVEQTLQVYEQVSGRPWGPKGSAR